MKTLNSTFLTEKNKLLLKFVRLYTLFDYDGLGNNLRFAENDSAIVFNGETYDPFPITINGVAEKSSGEATEVTLSVSNVSRLIEGYLQTYDLRKKKVTITYVHRDHLDDPAVRYVETLYIGKYGTNRQVATFTLKPLSGMMDMLRVELPLCVVGRGGCEWAAKGRFKGVECKYAGEATTCNGTLQQCRTYSNVLNYGAFPAAGGRRMFS